MALMPATRFGYLVYPLVLAAPAYRMSQRGSTALTPVAPVTPVAPAGEKALV
jgi:hypothetical protein